MFFNHRKKSAYSLVLFGLAISLVSQAEQATKLPELTIKPTKCVSLQQEQVCSVNATITWQTSELGDYCLASSQQNTPLKCWQSIQQGVFVQEVKMRGDITYTLIDKSTNRIIISKLLPLAWVYKKEKFSHSSWRIF